MPAVPGSEFSGTVTKGIFSNIRSIFDCEDEVKIYGQIIRNYISIGMGMSKSDLATF